MNVEGQLVKVQTIGLRSVVEAVGTVPPALAGVIAEINFDTVNYHRSSLLKRAKREWPAGVGAQRFLAHRLGGYGRKTRGSYPTSIAQATGESFVKPSMGGDRSYMGFVETGGTVSSGSDRFAVPIEALKKRGRSRSEAILKFNAALRAGRYVITKSGLIIDDSNKRRTVIKGVFRRSRRQRALLGFFAEWERIWPKQSAKYNQAADIAIAAVQAGNEEALTDLEGAMAAQRKARAQGASSQSAKRASAAAARLARARLGVKRKGSV